MGRAHGPTRTLQRCLAPSKQGAAASCRPAADSRPALTLPAPWWPAHAGAAGPQPAAAGGDDSAVAAHAEASDLEEEEGAALAAAGPAEAGEVAAAGEGEDEVGPEDWRLLLEAIRLYFTAAPVEDEELDGLNELDREILAAIAGVLSEEFEGGWRWGACMGGCAGWRVGRVHG